LKSSEVSGKLSLADLLTKKLPTDEVTLANGLALLADCNADTDAKYIIGTHIADDKFGSTTAAEREFGIANAIKLITDGNDSMIKELVINYGDKGTTYTWKNTTSEKGSAAKIGKITDLATYNTEKGKYNDLVDLKQYFGNIPSADQTYVKDVYNDLLDVMKEELDTYTTDISIKWPNDIYWKEKKICGMLIENDLMGRNISQSIVGIGININQEAFHGAAPNPVSIYQITGKQYDIFEIHATHPVLLLPA